MLESHSEREINQSVETDGRRELVRRGDGEGTGIGCGKSWGARAGIEINTFIPNALWSVFSHSSRKLSKMIWQYISVPLVH